MKKIRLVLFLLVLLNYSLIWVIQKNIDTMEKEEKEGMKISLLPSAESLRVISLGYQELVADLLWIKAIQYLGERYRWPSDDLTFYSLLDRITSLDPLYQYVYQAGGICLSHYGSQYELSNVLLKKGMSNLGERLDNNVFGWWIPFLVGFNYFFYLGDFENGAKYMMVASKLMGSPHYLPGLAATLLKRSGDPETGIAFLEKLKNETKDEVTRSYIEKTLEQKREEFFQGG